MVRWGKVHIANGGDKIRTSSAVSQAQASTVRDSSYVRVRPLLSILTYLSIDFISLFSMSFLSKTHVTDAILKSP